MVELPLVAGGIVLQMAPSWHPHGTGTVSLPLASPVKPHPHHPSIQLTVEKSTERLPVVGLRKRLRSDVVVETSTWSGTLPDQAGGKPATKAGSEAERGRSY